jgi:pimeloyl-ACP methyl ester carboxylesterase
MTTPTSDAQPGDPVVDAGLGPAVLLLHGTAPGTTAVGNFGQLIPALTGYRALAPDLLGFGNSAKPADVDDGPRMPQPPAAPKSLNDTTQPIDRGKSR